MVKLKNNRIFKAFGRLIGSVKDHSCKEGCSYFMPKGTEKRVSTLGFLIFCLCTFTSEVLFEFFSFTFHAFAKIKILFVTDAFADPLFLSVTN